MSLVQITKEVIPQVLLRFDPIETEIYFPSSDLLNSGVGKPDLGEAKLSRRAHNPQSGFHSSILQWPQVQINPPLSLKLRHSIR